MEKKRRRYRMLLLVLLLLGFSLIQVGLWHSHGSLVTFIRGQFDQGPDLAGVIPGKPGADPIKVRATLAAPRPVHRVAPEFLSFAIDSSQVVGGKWWTPGGTDVEMGSGATRAPVFDFNRPLLDRLTEALAPAYLRIGGSEADKIHYDMSGDDHPPVPEGYHSVLTRSQWDQVNAFTRRNGLRLVFTLNAGPSARDRDGRWSPENLKELLAYTARQNYRVSLWELGNELNLYWYIYGPSAQVKAAQYRRDLALTRSLIRSYFPDAGISGQGSAFWPVLGEPLNVFFSFMPEYMALSGGLTDVVSWHYYPQQSRRGFIASRRATPSRLLDPQTLDEAAYWGEKVKTLRDRYAPDSPLWLGETGNAQFGGEPGLSDRYLAGLWWMDQLGLMARTGHDVVVRQTLAGMDYGMIRADTLTPNPDYWNSLLWKRLMGTSVYHIKTDGPDTLRAYAHSSPEQENGLSLLFINLDHEKTFRLNTADLLQPPTREYHLDSDTLFSGDLYLNGKKLALANGLLPVISGNPGTAAGTILPPLSSVFITGKRK